MSPGAATAARIFWTGDDRQRFLGQLAHHQQMTGVVLYAYVLMLTRRGPGKALQAAAKANKAQIHAHPIVQRTISKYFPIMGGYIARSQVILDNAGIDVLKSGENLTWALKWDHSVEYAKAVAETLEKAYDAGIKAGGLTRARMAVAKALEQIADILSRGEKFRGL